MTSRVPNEPLQAPPGLAFLFFVAHRPRASALRCSIRQAVAQLL